MTHEFNYAKWYRRLFAFLIDLFIVFLFQIILYVPLILLDVRERQIDEITTPVSLIFIYGYNVFLKRFWQATLGMRILKIKIINQQGEVPTTHRLFARELLMNLLFIFTLGVSSLMIFWTRKRQTLYDMLTRTLIVDAH